MVTARAVAPLGRLVGWALPLLRTGGALLALKGASAADEAARDATVSAGSAGPTRGSCGAGSGWSTRRARSWSWNDLAAPDDGRTARGVERNGRDGRRPDAGCVPGRGRTPGEVPRDEVSRGTSPYADWTPIAEEAARAARVLHPDRHRMPRPVHRRVLTVANQKGGVGKTTSTVNVAAALAMHGVKVLVIDLDPQGNASTALGVEHRSGTPSVYELLLGELALGEAATPEPRVGEPLVRAGHDRPGRRGDRAGVDGRPRAAAQAGAVGRGARTSSASTTSSSTARRRSVC